MKTMRLFFAFFVMSCATGLQAMQVDPKDGAEVKKSEAQKPFKTECPKITQANLDLIDALLCGSLEGVQQALKAGANPNVEFCDNKLNTYHAICWAVRWKLWDIFMELYRHEANVVDAVGGAYKGNAVYWAAFCNWDDMITLLVKDFKMSVDKSNAEGLTPLHIAAEHPEYTQCEAAKTLLTLGANPLAVDAEGWLALHIAAKCGANDIIKLLVQDHKVPVNAQGGSKGKTPLDLALRFKKDTTAELLRSLGGQESKPAEQANAS